MEKTILKGCGTALVTPFRDGEVDYDSFKALLGRQLSAGIDFLVPLGTTAETPCLSDDEKCRIMDIVSEEAGSTPYVIGCGTNSVAGTIRNIRLLEKYRPEAFLVVVPFYNKPTDEGLYMYFKAISEATDIPILLYNVPGRTGKNMTAATTLRLAGLPGIAGVKEASGKLDQVNDIIRNRPEGFAVLSGNDDQTYEIMSAGGDGVISVVSNIAPDLMLSLTKALRDGNDAEASRLNSLLMPLMKDCFMESNPVPAKGALSLMGLCRNECRLPLTPAAPGTLARMKEILTPLGLL